MATFDFNKGWLLIMDSRLFFSWALFCQILFLWLFSKKEKLLFLQAHADSGRPYTVADHDSAHFVLVFIQWSTRGKNYFVWLTANQHCMCGNNFSSVNINYSPLATFALLFEWNKFFLFWLCVLSLVLQPVLLDTSSIQNDRILLMDTFFHLLIYAGEVKYTRCVLGRVALSQHRSLWVAVSTRSIVVDDLSPHP